MVRKRKAAPRRLDEEKRQRVTWNLSDLAHDVHVIPDGDASLLQERLEAEAEENCTTSVLNDVIVSRMQQSKQAALDLIDYCEFYLSVSLTFAPPKVSWHGILGQVTLTFGSCEVPEKLPSCNEFWLYIHEDSTQHLLYFELESPTASSTRFSMDAEPLKQVLYFKVQSDAPYEFWAGLKHKAFGLTLHSYEAATKQLILNLHVTEQALTRLQFDSEGIAPAGSGLRRAQQALQYCMAYLYGYSMPGNGSVAMNKKHNIEVLYEAVKQYHREEEFEVSINVQHVSLRPTLRPYQCQAVRWMIYKETQTAKFVSGSRPLHPLYQEFHLPDGDLLYYNEHGGMLVRERPCRGDDIPGGIIGEEMGLGKTVEVLACLLCHPRPGWQPPTPLPIMQQDQKAKKKKKKFVGSPVKGGSDTNILDWLIHERRSESQCSPVSDTTSDVLGSPTQEQQPLVDSNPISDITETHFKADVKQEAGGDSYGSHQGSGIMTPTASSDNAAGILSSNCSSDNKDMCSIKQPQMQNLYCPKNSDTQQSKDEKKQCVDMDQSSKPAGDCISASFPGNNEERSNLSVDTVILDHDYTALCDPQPCMENDMSGDIGYGEQAPGNQPSSCSKSDNDDKNLDKVGNDTAMQGAEEKNMESSKTKRKGKQRKCSKLDSKKTAKTTKTNSKSRRKAWTCSRTDNETMDLTKTNAKQKRKLKLAIHKAARTSDEDTDLEIDCVSYEEPKVEAVETVYIPPAMGPGNSLDCVCGLNVVPNKRKGPAVQCGECHQWQHASCVGYDLRDPLRGEYYCPQCHMIRLPITSGATLIISPRSISFQWVEEINRHIHKQQLKVMVYQGVQKRIFVQPQTLANHDVVITTYETLRKEIAFASAPIFKAGGPDEAVSLRTPKRYSAVPSPLVAVDWWRICLDEAQMVESTTTKAAEMALRLSTVNRWCVSGTPIQRSIEDLYGLLLFLGVEPYWVQAWWSRLLYTPYCHGNREPLHQLLSQVLWRTAKKDVLDQICLPPQTECLHWLTFSPVEEHFYRQQYRNCAAEALKQLRKWTDPDTKLSSLDRDSLHLLLLPLTRLRQACCHPQAVRGNFIAITKSTLTMEELLAQLTKKARLECEESHRQKVAATNALAGLDIIQSQYADAVEKYREVLGLVEEHKTEFRTDKLQQLHALHNLHEVLLLKPQGVGHTLRDSELQKEAAELKEVYMTKALNFVSTSQEGWNTTKAKVLEAKQEFRGLEDWWMDLLQWFVYRDLDLDLIGRVKEDLAENENPNMPTWTNRFRDLRGLQYLLGTHLEQTDQCYKTLLKNLRKLGGKPSVDLINSTTVCCLRPAGEILKTCPFCKCEEVFQEYEVKLFAFSQEGVLEAGDGDALATVGTKRQGTWADSQAEKSLKSLISFAKGFKGTQKFIEDGQAHLKLLDALKKEYRSMRKMWMALKEHVGAYDELDMATLRLRLRMPDEPVPDIPQPNIIEPAELEAQALKFSTDRIVATNELRKKRGQLLYLKNLVKSQDQLQGGENPELCPVCKGKLGTKWSVFHCGHCYCMDCVRLMADHYAFGGRNRSLRCAVCRQTTLLGDISYVCARQEAQEDEIRVKGDHSTKVEGVVRCLLKICDEDAEAKVLIFSTWVNLLTILGKALEDNGIEYRSLVGTGKFQRHLFSFKTERDIGVLMLPVHSGSNGLNLIEATHVFLVEPILNTAQELQAVGRVHRIGQTKPTFVHRFLVRNTIEDKMHHLLKTVQAPVNSHSSEETTMTVGDLRTLFQEVTEVEEEGLEGPDLPPPPNDTPPLNPLPAAEADPIPGPSGWEAHASPGPSVVESQDMPGPSVVESNSMSGHSAVESQYMPVFSAGETNPMPVPSVGETNPMPVPSAGETNPMPVPSAGETNPMPVPSASAEGAAVEFDPAMSVQSKGSLNNVAQVCLNASSSDSSSMMEASNQPFNVVQRTSVRQVDHSGSIEGQIGPHSNLLSEPPVLDAHSGS